MIDKKGRKHPNIEQKIYLLLSDRTLERWQDFDSICSFTGLTFGNVFRVISESGRIVLSNNRKEQPVISTRERYRQEEPFLMRLMDAFNNRIH